jgi:hypothetical protein
MSRTIGYDDLRSDTVRQVAKLIAAAASPHLSPADTLFLAGKPNFMET